MSNLSNNRLNTTATAAQIAAVKTALQTISTNLPFLIGLTTDERIALPAINFLRKLCILIFQIINFPINRTFKIFNIFNNRVQLLDY